MIYVTSVLVHFTREYKRSSAFSNCYCG